MAQNKRVRTNVIFTIIVVALAATKLIIWLVSSGDVSWIFEFPDCILNFPTFCGIFVSAFLTIITVWLPPKPKLWFGIVSLLISYGMWAMELALIGLFVCIKSWGTRDTPIEQLYPLLTAGVIAVLMVTTITSRKREKPINPYNNGGSP